ncbi:g-D-glutamyl-meso-diaminopimelate peptidase [Bacillus ectoiniformans]|uniref:M14 family metallopeptidase n=1 Tax=Bacillus ectoiniformans TaxID=1494429 RepID=UPI00195E52A0|nr:M14 family zinc carboxypeptidase [Bacillus ectoiniformans]MBM7649332.1 g-D-glutamyl-meso-diaminopimelate peptidase [Bacillus ectoiniformans]
MKYVTKTAFAMLVCLLFAFSVNNEAEASGAVYFKVVKEELPFYSNETGKLEQKGTLLKDMVLKAERSYGANWYEIKVGGQMRYVAKYGTVVSTSGPSFTQGKTASKVALNVEASVLENVNGKLVPVGRLAKGEQVESASLPSANWFVISFAGKKGYIYKTNVTSLPMPRDVVNPYQNYSYEQMVKDIQTLKMIYPDLIDYKTIGRSVDGRDIYAVKIGKGKVEMTGNGSHHAREHITTNLVMEMLDQYALAYHNNTNISSYSVRKQLNAVTMWFVPMVNPDGVTLVQKGHRSAKNPSYVVKLNNGSTNFNAWKANIRGVDLNRQYPANWANIVGDPGRPGPRNYKGPSAFSEPETQAMRDFTRSHRFESEFAFHSSGQILYWHYKQTGALLSESIMLAKKISRMTGYQMVPAKSNPSGGGYTDWFIEEFKRPGFTPEVSPYVGDRPVPISNFNDIWRQNKAIMLMVADHVS